MIAKEMRPFMKDIGKEEKKMVNLNDLAVEITKKEGGKVNLSIAQVKEVMELTLTEVSLMPPDEISKILNRYRKKYRKKDIKKTKKMR